MIAPMFLRVCRVSGLYLRLLFGLLAVFIGVAIIGWVCYNEFIAPQPEYPGTRWWQPLGIAPVMLGVGIYWLRGLRKSEKKLV